MLKNKKVACIIPARLASVRFPEKMLQMLAGKPLLQWVWEAVVENPIFDECHFAVDSEKTAKIIGQFGASYFMTSPFAESGTDRLVEIMNRKLVEADIWVNWQGDEPFITKQMIDDLLLPINFRDDEHIWTLKKRITDDSQITAVNIAKVVTDIVGNALYFSRSPIPFYRDQELKNGEFYKHVGLYAFSSKGLSAIGQLVPSGLEKAEKLEQLRFLEHGLKIRVHETAFDVRGIDTIEDLQYAEGIIRSKNFISL